MKRISLYLIAAFVSFSLFLVIFAPASTLLFLVKDEINQRVPELVIDQVSGTVWDGQATLHYREFPPSLLNFRLDPMALAGGSADLALSLTGDFIDVEASVSLSNESIRVSGLHGVIDSEYINNVSQQHGLLMTGPFSLKQITLHADSTHVLSAAGQVSWAGGKIESQTGSGLQVFELPGLSGEISVVMNDLALRVHKQGTALLNARLKHNGWITVSVKAALFELAGLNLPSGQPVSENTQRGDTVLEFEEKIL